MIFDCGKLQRIPKRKAFLLSIFPSWLHVGRRNGKTENKRRLPRACVEAFLSLCRARLGGKNERRKVSV